MYKYFSFYDISIFDIKQKVYIDIQYIVIRYINNANGGVENGKRKRLLLKNGIVLRPEFSALLMGASSIIVAANAVMLKRTEKDLISI